MDSFSFLTMIPVRDTPQYRSIQTKPNMFPPSLGGPARTIQHRHLHLIVINRHVPALAEDGHRQVHRACHALPRPLLQTHFATEPPLLSHLSPLTTPQTTPSDKDPILLFPTSPSLFNPWICSEAISHIGYAKPYLCISYHCSMMQLPPIGKPSKAGILHRRRETMQIWALSLLNTFHINQ
jgi:hypothetical protein